ncbi:MAG: (deoxy)nucleoside triphosphate pyrophosphohydrolase [Bdellovibrionales bacterium]
MKSPLLVVAAIILKGEKILLAKRPMTKTLPGMWEFPGGKVESGESLEKALKRELFEELHLSIKVQHRLGRYFHTYDWGELEMVVFIVTPMNEPRLTSEVAGVEWMAQGDIDPGLLAPADRLPLLDFLKWNSDQSRT